MVLALIMTLIAGLSTGIGGIISILVKKDNTKFLSLSLGFSAGVMIYVSMIELFNQAQKSLVNELGDKMGNWITVIAFFLGMLLIGVIDRLVPEQDNPHEIKKQYNKGLMHVGIITALSIAIHNFPEGMATFISAMQDSKIAIPIVFAIAIHNIPEGIAVATPIYYASGSKSKAFWYSLLSGLAEPVGALVAYLILLPFMSDTLFGILYALIAGIMVFISFDELLPTAEAYGNHHLSLYGVIIGMIVMAISLLLFI